MSRHTFASPVILLLTLAPHPTSAEPIALPSFQAVVETAGSLGRLNEVFLRLAAPGLSFSGETDRSTDPSPLRPCGSCQPDTLASFTGTHRLFFHANGPATITIDDEEMFLPNIDARLAFSSPESRIPPAANDVSHVIAPLVVNGEMRLITSTRRSFIAQITGSGQGRARIGADPAFPGQFFAAVTLRFASDPAPVPEPTTLLLLGPTIVGVVMRRRK